MYVRLEVAQLTRRVGLVLVGSPVLEINGTVSIRRMVNLMSCDSRENTGLPQWEPPKMGNPKGHLPFRAATNTLKGFWKSGRQSAELVNLTLAFACILSSSTKLLFSKRSDGRSKTSDVSLGRLVQCPNKAAVKRKWMVANVIL